MEIDGFTDAMIRRATEGDARLQHATDCVGQFSPGGIQEGDMLQARRAGGRR